MSERYTRLFSLPENLYSVGAPVVIAAGALLKDNQTGKVLAQLKIQNISDKTVKAATVSIVPMDTVGKPLGEAVSYQYLDLNARRDADFGQKIPVVLPNTATRAFCVSVSEVIFADNAVWRASEAVWEPLSAPVPLEQALGDKELVAQYQIKYGENCKCIFKREKDLWRCACGALNHDTERFCHKCRKEAAILSAFDLDELKAGKDKRLEIAKQKAAEEKAAAEAKSKRTKKLAMIVVPIAVVAIVTVVLISGNLKKSAAYNDAVALLEAGDYDGAISAFEALGNYKDSAEQIKQAQYDKAEQIKQTQYDEAIDLLSQAEYDEAILIFETLGDYKDSANQIENVQSYLHAIELLDSGDYEAAAEIFATLGGFGDSTELLALIEEFGPYAPYIGQFIYVLHGDETYLSSDFVMEDENVFWEVTIPVGNLIGISIPGRGQCFFLSDGNTKRWPVNDDMTVIDAREGMGTVTVKFENGSIIVTGSGSSIKQTDDTAFWNRCYVKAR